MIGQTTPEQRTRVATKRALLDFIVRAQRPFVGLKLVQSIRAATHGLKAEERHNYHHS